MTVTMQGPANEPMFISVETAAHLMGISRTLAYDMAHLGIETGGREGLPAIRMGRRLLVRRTALETMQASGPP